MKHVKRLGSSFIALNFILLLYHYDTKQFWLVDLMCIAMCAVVMSHDFVMTSLYNGLVIFKHMATSG